MGFLEISLMVFENLISLLMNCFLNTSSQPRAGDEDRIASSSTGAGEEDRATSSSTLPKQNYEVFLSFRGKDTRYGFTDYLYHGLEEKGIDVFRDNEKLHVGEMIDQLLEAIKTSKISIPIISADYTSSIWCLKELVQILECKKMSRQLVLPIFYYVKPSDVREQKGDFGKNFQLCKKKYNLERKFVREVENAFEEVATMKGWEVNETENRYEGELVKKVVARIFKELEKAVLNVPKFLVGVDEHVEKIMKMIDTKSNDAKIIGVYGMGGIGKTTLAKVLYNALCADFECCSFVPNIREASKTKGMEALQKQIIGDILADRSLQEISNVEKGITILEERFKGKNFLLLLDDVENEEQLNVLVPQNSSFGPKSIVIITTRNKVVRVPFGENLSYELFGLNMDHSYELFCEHAFGRDSFCPSDLETLARDIVSTTGGLPLAVEVIGSFLYQKDGDEELWKETLEKLREVSNEKVRDKLKISYDYLEYGQKQIFLDIACLPIHYELEYASYMWNSCKFNPREGIEKLISLSLIKKDDRLNAITIHDQLRDLGREIVRNEGRDNFEVCSRIWSEEKAIEVMERKQGTDKVLALILPYHPNEKLHYTSEDFEGMIRLRFLRMHDVRLTGDFEKLFLNLKWLSWGSPFYHFDSGSHLIDVMGINFNPIKLVVLELYHSNITDQWKGWRHMKDLKVINLQGCVNLTTIPDLSAMKSLESLKILQCEKLIEIRGFQELKSLKFLNILGCKSLQHLPDLSQCTKLESLNVEGCEKLSEIRGLQGLQELKSLKSLTISGCKSLLHLPYFLQRTKLERLNVRGYEEFSGILVLQELKSLKSLNLSGCKSLQHLPDLSQYTKLEMFNIESCETLSEIRGLQELKSLESLDILGCKSLQHLPDLSQCTKLEMLDVAGCEKLSEIRGLQELKSLESLHISECKSLQHLSDLSQCTKLERLDVAGCEKLSEIRGLQELKSLESLHISECKSLQHLPDLSQCAKLEHLYFWDCEKLIKIRGLQELKSLKFLHISGCKSLQHLPDLSQCLKLKRLYFRRHEKLSEIRGLQELKSLESLDISGCKSLQHLPDLSQCTKLKCLYFRGCEKLVEIQELQELKSLESLDISGYKTIQHLPDLSQCTKLKLLYIRGCEKLTEIRGLHELKSLECLDISGCKSLQHLPDLSQCTTLKGLCFRGCEKLVEIQGLHLLMSLESLNISRCKSLQHLSDLSQCTKLKQLYFWGCEKLTEIRGLQELKSMKTLDISGYKSL